jgi:hypothetical protein
MSGKNTAARDTKNTRRASDPRPVTPSDIESLPRFAPSPTALGEALADRILEGFRKDLESVDLRAKTHKRHASRQK